MHLEFKGQLAVFWGVDNFLSVVSSYLWIEVGSIKFKLNDSVVEFKLPGNKFHFGVIVLIFSRVGTIVPILDENVIVNSF
jgi:hypothetical protein